MWEPEEILDSATLYYRLHRNFLDANGFPVPGAFRNRPNKKTDGMSTDWDQYSTAYESWQRCAVPEDNIIIELSVGIVRKIPGQTVEHTPRPTATDPTINRAHTDVFGEKTTEARAKFMAAVEWPEDDRVIALTQRV